MHQPTETSAVTVAVPLEILGVKVVEIDAGAENAPSEEVQAIEAPPLIIALKSIASPLQAMTSGIGSIDGAALITSTIVVGMAHSPGLGVKV